MTAKTCAHPDCERPAGYRCVVCKDEYCAFHIYDKGGYICTIDFNEPQFEDPHASKNSATHLKFRKVENWLSRLLGRD